MIADWPVDLPRPERNTWQLQPQDARRKTQADAGPPRYRRRFSSAGKMVTLSLILSRNGKAIFDNFFHDTCAEGSHLFYMPDPTTDGWPIFTAEGLPLLVSPSGAPLLMSARWLCSWGDQTPVETLQGLEFRKTFSVVVLP